VNVLLASGVVLVITAIAVAVMLLVRRHAPVGSRFTDGDRASGVFGVLATGFSVLIGFVIFLNFSSYDASRAGAEAEALVVSQQVQTAALLPPAVSDDLIGELICYSRSVIGPEWDRLEDGDRTPSINEWGVAMFLTLRDIKTETQIQESAYDRWMDQTNDREQARNDRIHGAAGITPLPLWVVLIFISAVIFVYALFFADSGESAVTQGMLMGSVVAVLSVLLLLLVFLGNPYQRGIGGLRPTAMERTLSLIALQLDVAHLDVQPPCDAVGEKLP
jgi:hypothetical protein